MGRNFKASQAGSFGRKDLTNSIIYLSNYFSANKVPANFNFSNGTLTINSNHDEHDIIIKLPNYHKVQGVYEPISQEEQVKDKRPEFVNNFVFLENNDDVLFVRYRDKKMNKRLYKTSLRSSDKVAADEKVQFQPSIVINNKHLVKINILTKLALTNGDNNQKSYKWFGFNKIGDIFICNDEKMSYNRLEMVGNTIDYLIEPRWLERAILYSFMIFGILSYAINFVYGEDETYGYLRGRLHEDAEFVLRFEKAVRPENLYVYKVTDKKIEV